MTSYHCWSQDRAMPRISCHCWSQKEKTTLFWPPNLSGPDVHQGPAAEGREHPSVPNDRNTNKMTCVPIFMQLAIFHLNIKNPFQNIFVSKKLRTNLDAKKNINMTKTTVAKFRLIINHWLKYSHFQISDLMVNVYFLVLVKLFTLCLNHEPVSMQSQIFKYLNVDSL